MIFVSFNKFSDRKCVLDYKASIHPGPLVDLAWFNSIPLRLKIKINCDYPGHLSSLFRYLNPSIPSLLPTTPLILVLLINMKNSFLGRWVRINKYLPDLNRLSGDDDFRRGESRITIWFGFDWPVVCEQALLSPNKNQEGGFFAFDNLPGKITPNSSSKLISFE